MSKLEQYRTVLNPNSANAMMIYLGPNTGSEPVQEAKDELIIALDDKQQSQALYIKRLEEYLKDDWIKNNNWFGTSEGMEAELMNIADGEYDEYCQEIIREFEAQE